MTMTIISKSSAALRLQAVCKTSDINAIGIKYSIVSKIAPHSWAWSLLVTIVGGKGGVPILFTMAVLSLARVKPMVALHVILLSLSTSGTLVKLVESAEIH
jgi:hypothetical protein